MVGGNIFRALRRYLSWIEGLTTNQNVTGSNPVRRTSRNENPGRASGSGFLQGADYNELMPATSARRHQKCAPKTNARGTLGVSLQRDVTSLQS